MINRELIVIPKDGEASYEYHKSEVTDSHQDNLIMYIMKNNINIDIYTDPFIHTLGLEMAYLDYVVICIYGREFCIYLPSELTSAQAKWFYDRKQSISQVNVLIINVDKTNDKKYEINFIEEYAPGSDPVDMLYEKIKEKTIQIERMKKKTYGNKQ